MKPNPLENLYKKLENSESKNIPKKEEIWDKISSRIEEQTPSKTFRIHGKYAIAATVLLGLGIGLFFFIDSSYPKEKTSYTQQNAGADTPLEEENAFTESAELSDDTQEIMAEDLRQIKESLQNAEVYAFQKVNNQHNQLEQRMKRLETHEKSRFNNHEMKLKFSTDKEVIFDAINDNEGLMDGIEHNNSENRSSAPLAEMAIKSPEYKKKEADFYVIDGRVATKEEAEALAEHEVESITYMSNSNAVQKGYIKEMDTLTVNSSPKFNRSYWITLNVNKLNTKDLKTAKVKLSQMDTMQLSVSDRNLRRQKLQAINQRLKK